MRWDELFADLEGEARGLEQRERDLEIAERTRIELGRIALLDRLSAGAGHDVELRVPVLGSLTGRLERVTPHWLLLGAGTVQWVVGVEVLVGIRGLPAQAMPAERGSHTRARLGWGAAWRVLARDRTAVHVVRRDRSTLDAVADRVGADFVELTVAGGGPRQRELVPFTAVVAVRCPRG